MNSVPAPSKSCDSAVSRIPALDGLRGIAILLVLVCHFYEFRDISIYLDRFSWRKIWGLAAFGWSGVDLFFALSGFLITSILFNTKETPGYFRSFYGRRVVRIFPLYFICVFSLFHLHIPALQYSPDGRWIGIDPSHEIWFWTYIANWKTATWGPDQLSHFWSLCVEEQFYFIWPLVVWLTGKRTFPWLCLGVIVASVCTGVGFELAGFSRVFVFASSFPRVEAIVLGSLIAWLVRHKWVNKVTGQLKIVIPAFFGLMLICALNPPYFRGFYTLEFLIAGLAWSAILLHCVTNSSGMFVRLTQGCFLRTFGKFSYAIYVWHRMVFYYLGFFMGDLLKRWNLLDSVKLFLLFVSFFSASLLAGFLSWHFFEKHFLRLRSFLPYKVGSPSLSEREVVPAPAPSVSECPALTS